MTLVLGNEVGTKTVLANGISEQESHLLYIYSVERYRF